MKKWLFLTGVVVFLLNAEDAFAQQEIELEAIKVKAQVDKPRVSITPKRMQPDFEEFYIERNFDVELRQLNTQVLAINPENEPVTGKPDIARLTSRKRR